MNLKGCVLYSDDQRNANIFVRFFRAPLRFGDEDKLRGVTVVN